jgi:hypothetical protein
MLDTTSTTPATVCDEDYNRICVVCAARTARPRYSSEPCTQRNDLEIDHVGGRKIAQITSHARRKGEKLAVGIPVGLGLIVK